ncbi:MAG TPA: CerR family C-terminal domain-containing protein [Gemmatimonadaceae bacterium]|nr:CerR family C-terminal domain-containing protein [Gemmatimonadaceae bacterium]
MARRAADVAETRARLLDAARRLFAERGFADVTVRELCREAGANLALVNYYFGDKLGLYLEVVNEAIAGVREFNSLAITAPEGSGAEERLRLFVRGLLYRVFERRGVDTWVHRLIQHELSRPTELATRILQEAMAPRIRYLADIVAELLSCPKKDPRVMNCVASVHGLCLVYSRIVLTDRFKAVMPDLATDGPFDVEDAIAHVSAFSLAGIRAMRR